MAKTFIAATDVTAGGNGGVAEARALCPADTRAVGGGVVPRGDPEFLFVAASGALNASGDVAQTADGDHAAQWYAAVTNYTSVTRAFRVFALCSATSQATIATTDFTIPGGQSATAAALCPNATRVVGGGVIQLGAPTNLFTRVNGPLAAGGAATQWTTTVLNTTTATTRAARVFALCASATKATIKSAQVTAPAGETRAAFVRCRNNQRVVGGGVTPIGAADGLFVHASGPLAAGGHVQHTNDGDTATQWYGSIRNDASVARTVRIYAICTP